MTQESLAKQLGYPETSRLLIINCDDFGSSHSANLAIKEAIQRGIATSATLMVPCPWALEAVSLSSGFAVGIHLTLTSEYPVYRWRSITGERSLHDDQGYMPLTTDEVWARAHPADVEEECRAQIKQALSWGVDITHLDAHMGTLQLEARFFEIYLKLALEFGLPIRMVGASYEQMLRFSPRSRARAQGVVFPDHLVAPKWGTPARNTLIKRLGDLRSGVSEIYLHPVRDGAELRGYDPEHAALRADDFDCLVSQDLKERASRSGIVLIDYRPLRELMRSAAAQ
ncbi:MAG: polysaccharide deacetylase family protein [Alphaproteobacteria bacterium]|nr:polysaccharide deacetylase family protein [Alphaproteobacteria bacterium]